MNILEQLKGQFPGQLVLYASDLAQVLGKSEKALSHLIARGQLPFPIKKLGGKHCVSIFHVAQWLAEGDTSEAGLATVVEKPKAPRRRRSEVRSGIGARLMEMRLEATRVLLSVGDEFAAEVANVLAVGTVAAALVVRLRGWRQLGEQLVSSESRVALDDEREVRAVIAWLRDAAEGSAYAQLTVRERRVELYRAQLAGGKWRVATDKL